MNRPDYFRLLALLAPVCLVAGQAKAQYVETKLISNEAGVAPVTDPNLTDPWGLAFSATGPIWVSNQYSGTATVYKITGLSSSATQLTVGVANSGGALPSYTNGPTGQVSTAAPGVTTGTSDFPVSGGKSSFIFDNLDGSISAWRGGLTASAITTSVSGASFTGLAIGDTSGGAAQIYAADQNSGNVDVFNSQWQQAGTLTDPNLPAGFTTFNVQNINGTLFVTYANPDDPIGGLVDEFTTNGSLITRLISDPTGTHLDSPWGVAVAPAGWGQFGGDLLVGNNGGDATINAYSLAGAYEGQLTLNTNSAFSEQQLWGLSFGNGGSFGSPNILYYSAGYTSDATNGLIGAISVPEPASAAIIGALAIGQLGRGRRRSKSCRRDV